MSTPPAATDAPPERALADFEAVYRANVAGIISRGALRVRLFRARTRLRKAEEPS